jgi:hypothetical protein
MKSTGTDTDREPSIAGLRLLASHDARIALQATVAIAVSPVAAFRHPRF